GARRTLNLGVRSAAPGFRRLRARGLTRDLRTGRAVWGRRRGRSRARPAALRRLRRTVGDDRAAAAAILPADRIGPRGLEAALDGSSFDDRRAARRHVARARTREASALRDHGALSQRVDARGGQPLLAPDDGREAGGVGASLALDGAGRLADLLAQRLAD